MDNLITDLLAKRNYTQARKAIEKKLKQKKFEDNISLLLAKATVQHGLGEYPACLELCTQLCHKKPLSHDVDEVKRLYELLGELREHVTVDETLFEKLWRNAVTSQPKGQQQQDWSEEWASQAIRHRHWTLLTKAAMVLKQSAPQGSSGWRKYSFWLITAQWLASRGSPASSTSDQNDQRLAALNATLATRQLDDAVKAAGNADQNGISTNTRLRIDNRKDLKLLAHVFAQQENFERLIEVLEDFTVKSIAGDDDDFAIYLREAMVHSRDAAEVQKWLQDVVRELKEGPNGYSRLDDWQIWTPLLYSDAQLRDTDMSKQESPIKVLPIIEQAIEPGKLSRSARLAKLELQCGLSSCGSACGDAEAALLEHFQHNAGQGFVADDIKRHLHQIDNASYARIRGRIEQDVKPESLQTMESSDQLKWLTSEINILKLDLMYLKIKSQAGLGTHINGTHNGHETPNAPNVELLKTIVVNAISLYKLSRAHTAKIHEKAMHPGDEACLLAVDALLTLALVSEQSNAMVLQALCLLDFVLSDNKHNFLARTQITGLLQHFGLYSLAATAYQALDVKEILHETMSPLLFLRIGSLQAPDGKGFNNYDAMSKPLDFYSKSLDKIPDYQTLALDHENYTQAIHMHQFREQLESSPTRLMLLFERRRLARLVHNQLSVKTPINESDIANRLRRAYTGAAEVSTRAQPDRHPGPPPSKAYNEWLMLVDLALDLARSDQLEHANVQAQQTTFIHLKKMLEARIQATSLTEAERNVQKAAEAILSVSAHISGTTISGDLLDITAALDVLDDVVVAFVQKFATGDFMAIDILPRWEMYHETYLALEFCQVLDVLMVKLQKAKSASPAKKAMDSKAGSILASIKDVFEAIQNTWNAHSKQIAGYSGGEILGMVMRGLEGSTDDVVGEAVYEVMGSQNAKRLLLSYVNAAKVSIDAVLDLKLKK